MKTLSFTNLLLAQPSLVSSHMCNLIIFKFIRNLFTLFEALNFTKCRETKSVTNRGIKTLKSVKVSNLFIVYPGIAKTAWDNFNERAVVSLVTGFEKFHFWDN